MARWQMLAEGMTDDAARWWARDLRTIFDGVYLTGCGPLTQRQRWWAAALTAPHTSLAFASAAAAHRIRGDVRSHVTVVRSGSCGPERASGLLVAYSATLAGNLTRIDGVPATTVERTIIDLWPHLPTVAERHKLVREALRIGRTTARRLLDAIRRHKGHRGIRQLRLFVARYQHLPFHPCRSDAEAFALTVLDDAGVEIPMVNTRHAGEEADFCWFALRRILEIDGPQFHRFIDVDARKTAAWNAAGFAVERLPTTRLFADPRSLLALAPPPTRAPNADR